MRHLKRKVRLTTTQGHRKAILMNLAKSVFTYKRIQTTFSKAKAVQPLVERILTYSKRGGLHAYRLVESELHDQRLVKRVVEVIAPYYKDRHGGCTRIVKTENRVGDNSPMALFELIGDFTLTPKKKETAEPAKESKGPEGSAEAPAAKKVVKKVVVK
jgi:large subunit ribosomal protein L17